MNRLIKKKQIMKKIKYYAVLIIISVFMIFTSCNDTYEFHEKYTKDGEIIYTNKVDSLTTLSGDNRIEIKGYISNAFNVKEIEVVWDKGESSKLFDYSKSTNETDLLELFIDNLEERSYEFEVYSKDSDGNKSIRVLTYGTVYGEVHRSNLTARYINTFALASDHNVTLSFKDGDELTRNTEVKYTNMNNEEVVSVLALDESIVILVDLDISKPIEYRTFYVPTPKDLDGNETSIDEFGSDWVTYDYPLELKTILESMTFVPILGGINVNWENPDNLELNLQFQKIVGGEEVLSSTTSNESLGSYILGGMESGEQVIEITIENIYKNSWASNFTVTPIPAVLLDKSNWTIIDFDSEEPAESNWGPPTQGLAAAVIDGDLGTFWHTAWEQTQPDYPHYFTIDMGAEKTIASFEIFRRGGAWWSANKHEFWVSSDNVNWEKVAELDSWLENDSGYSVSAPSIPTARYVKYVVTEGYDYYAFLAEINIYGLE
jgi:hypothetical protein